MSRLLLFVFTALLAFSADNPWAKVKDLKTGTEIRIYKIGVKQPIVAKMDELSDESLVVILKNEQTAIPKEDIDRIDYRPPQNGSRATRETKTTTELPQPVGPRPTPGNSVPGSSSSTTVSSASKPDFETIYRRTAEPPAQK